MPLPIRAIGPVFTPRHLANLVWWIDASDSSALTLDGTSGKITTITDRGPNSRNATQATDANRASVGTLNGLQCLDFGNASSSIQYTMTATAAQEICAVCKDDTTGSTFADFYCIASSANGGALQAFNNLSLWLDAGSGSILGDNFLTNAIVGRGDGASPTLKATVQAGAVAFASANSGTQNMNRFGNDRNIAGRSWRGRIGEVCLFSSALTTEERRRMRLYLACKWSIAGAIY